ncbi:unnamed protein product [Pleuronectes platessa]|uniref:Uncharacterized protein n=1 Tax=Pleuronectes platessa TaxID=8262 RepID=A0A9N7TX15_PLEPL|nr:unnamed protein product [Pleuronectes platessa]
MKNVKGAFHRDAPETRAPSRCGDNHMCVNGTSQELLAHQCPRSRFSSTQHVNNTRGPPHNAGLPLTMRRYSHHVGSVVTSGVRPGAAPCLQQESDESPQPGQTTASGLTHRSLTHGHREHVDGHCSGQVRAKVRIQPDSPVNSSVLSHTRPSSVHVNRTRSTTLLKNTRSAKHNKRMSRGVEPVALWHEEDASSEDARPGLESPLGGRDLSVVARGPRTRSMSPGPEDTAAALDTTAQRVA